MAKSVEYRFNAPLMCKYNSSSNRCQLPSSLFSTQHGFSELSQSNNSAFHLSALPRGVASIDLRLNGAYCQYGLRHDRRRHDTLLEDRMTSTAAKVERNEEKPR